MPIIGDIVHTVGTRYRVKGSGYLRTRLWNLADPADLDVQRNEHLDNIIMSTTSARERTILANFQDQGYQIQFKVRHMDETFIITKIVSFVKPVAESYPILSGG